MGPNPFVQMAFGCAPLYIRLAAFLSAVNPSVSCGSWYLNVTLELPTNLQLQQLRRRRCRSSPRWLRIVDTINITRHHRHREAILSSRHVPVSRPSHESANVYKSPATELHHFHSCSCLNRGSLSSSREISQLSLKEFQLRDGIVFSDRPKVASACQFGLFGTFVYRKLRFSVGTANVKRQEQARASTWRLLSTKTQFAMDFDILPDVLSITRRHDWGENGARRYPYTWFDSLPQVGEKVDPFIPHYLRFSGGHFRQIFNIYRLLSRFSTRTLAV